MANFDKYTTRSADYHYRQIDRGSLKTMSLPVMARFERLVEAVRSLAGNRSLKLLDVGCGDGVALFLLSRALPNLTLYGIEPVPEALSVARAKVPQAQLMESEADVLPFPDKSFDIVISTDVIEHVPDTEAMLGEIKRVAKDNADIIVGTPIKHSKVPLDHNHVQEFFVEDFKEMLSRYFKEVRVYETHNLAHMLFYNAPTHSFFNFKYLLNLLSWTLGWNPFLKERKNRIQMFAYMTAVCKK